MSEVKFRDGSADALKKIGALRDIALTESAIVMQGEVIVRCPVRTGHLKGSISRKVRLGDGSVQGDVADGALEGAPAVGVAVVGTNVSYAPHVEYGTKYQRAQPYMRSGAVAAEPKIRQVFQNRLGQPVEVTRFKEETHAV